MTAENITIPPFDLPPLPTLKGVLNPRVGDKLLATDNQFQQERLLGSELVHHTNEDRLLVNPGGVLYMKNVRKEVPPVMSEPRRGDDSHQSTDTGVTQRRGMRRWTALPDVIEVSLTILSHHQTLLRSS